MKRTKRDRKLSLVSSKRRSKRSSGINSTSSQSSSSPFALNYSSAAAAGAAFYMTNTQQPSRSFREILEESSTSDAGLRYQSGGRVTLSRPLSLCWSESWSESQSRLDNSSEFPDSSSCKLTREPNVKPNPLCLLPNGCLC